MAGTTIVIAAALAAALPAVSAQALSSIRTYVSTTGGDSNPCSITQPCQHFSAALAVTATGGRGRRARSGRLRLVYDQPGRHH